MISPVFGDNRPNAEEQISGMLFAVFLLDSDLRIAEANHAAEEMLGRSSKRLAGMDFGKAAGLPKRVIERISLAESQLVARGVAISPAGRDRVVNVTFSPLSTHPDWRIVTMSDAGQDDMRGTVESPSALKAPAILAHEIKNPLAAIKGASQLLAKKVGPAEGALTTMIGHEVDRIARLIDRMQELGSHTSGPLEPVNLHQTIRKAMASVRSASKDRAELDEEFDPSLPAVAGHPDMLEQVLVNLLANAVDACAQRDDARVSVRTRFVSGLALNVGGEGEPIRLPIEIAVCDNGPGISSDVADHIFEPFVSSKKSGQGLGLALVKKLVGDMGGRVNVKRLESAGITEFRVHLAVSEGAGA